MPLYNITNPDTGDIYEIDTGDEEASPEDLTAYAREQVVSRPPDRPLPDDLLGLTGELGRRALRDVPDEATDILGQIPGQTTRAIQASGEHAPGAGMEGMPGMDPSARPTTDPLEAMGVLAPMRAAPPFLAAESVGGQFFEEISSATGDKPTVPGYGEVSPETFKSIGAGGAVAAIGMGMKPFPMTRGAMNLGREIRTGAGTAARAEAGASLAAGLARVKEAKLAAGAAEAVSKFDDEVTGLAQKAIPERATQQRQIPQYAESLQEGDAARRAALKGRAAEQTEQIKGAVQPEYAARIEARKGRAAHQLDVLKEQFEPQAPRHMAFGEAGDIVRQDVRHHGTNEEILGRLVSGEEGAELTSFLRRGFEQGASGDWIPAGTLEGADIKTFMRLKNRGLIETRGPKGAAEYKLTDGANEYLVSQGMEEAGTAPKYLKEQAGIDKQATARLNEMANERFGKPLQKLTKQERAALEMPPISGGADQFPAGEAFVRGDEAAYRPTEIMINTQRFVDMPPQEVAGGITLTEHVVDIPAAGGTDRVARIFSWKNSKTGATGFSDVNALGETGLGKPAILRAIEAAGGDSKWVRAGEFGEVASQDTLKMLNDLEGHGLIQTRYKSEVVGGLVDDFQEVRLAQTHKRLKRSLGPNPHTVEKLAQELDISPAAGMEIDPNTGTWTRRDVRGLKGGRDPDVQARVHDAAAGEQTRAYNLSAKGARAMRAKNIDELATIREVLKSDVEDVLTKSLDVATGDTPAARAGLGESIARLLDSRSAAESTPALGGRSLTILKQMEKDVEVAEKIAHTLARFNPKKPGYVESVARFLTDLETTAAKGKVSFGDGVFFSWLNGRLSGPWTHVKNQVSNTARLAVRPLTRFYAGGIDMVHSTFTGAERSIYAGEAFADVVGIMHGIPEAARSMMRVWSQGPSKSIFGSTTKLEFLRLAGQPKGKLGSIVGSPGRAMVAADEFYKVLSYEGSVASQLYRASKQVGGNVDNVADDVLASIAKQASMEADLTTYTNRLTERGRLGHTLSGLSKLRGKVGRYIVPFFNTNTNVILEGLAHTPVLGFGTAGHQTGEIAMRGFKGSLAKQAAGTTGAVGAALMIKAMGGQITGGGPSDPNARKTLMASGWKPYSIKLPGLPPMSMTEVTGLFNVLGMVGDAYDLAEEGVVDMEDAAQRISRSIIKQYSYPPFASGIQDLLDVWQDGDVFGTVAQKWLQRQASTVVPAGVGFLAQLQDPTIRRPQSGGPMGEGIEQSVRSNVPYLQGDTPALRDIWGREIKRTLGPLETILGGTQPEITDVDREVGRLAKIQDEDGTSLLAISGTVDEIRNTELTSDEYDQYQARAGELARLSVTAMIGRGRWSNLSDEARAKAIKDTFKRSRKRAKNEIIRSSKDLQKRIRDTAIEARRRLTTPRAPGKALQAVRRRNQ